MSGSLDNLIRTVFGEARGEDPRGQQAVASVILNRARQTGQSYDDVVTAPGQFEPWGNPVTRARMLALTPDSPDYQAIAANIAPALNGDDPTGGADHFYSPTAQSSLGRAAPSWDNGKGTDIGRHRFFALGYGGSSPMASSSLASGADIFGLGAPETSQGAPQSGAPQASGSGADIFGLSDTIAPAPGPSPAPLSAPTAQPTPITAKPAPGASPGPMMGGEVAAPTGDGTVVNAETGTPYNAAQTKTIQDRFHAGKFDLNAQAGSELLPFAQTKPGVIPSPGNWYVDLDGKLLQARNEARDANAGDSWLHTASDMATALNPATFSQYTMMPDAAKDPRAAALMSGLTSGAAMGGKNEIAALLQSIPGFLSGGIPQAQKSFDTNLQANDAQDKALGDAFPAMMNTGRVAGTVAGGVAIPGIEGGTALARGGNLALQSALGGAGGFLSTDGTTGDRVKGAEVGAISAPLIALGLDKVLGPMMRMLRPMTNDVGASGMAANQALTDLGSSYHDLSPEGQAAVRAAIARGQNPADAARIAMGQDLPVPVPMSRGQVTGLPSDQLDLNLALRGAKGPGAAATAQEFQAAQQAALRANVDAIGGGMTGGQTTPPWGSGGARASDTLNNTRASMEAGVNQSFDAARNSSGEAVLPRYDMQALAGSMFNAVQEGHAFRDVPAVAAHIRDVLNMSDADGDIRRLFEVRARLSGLRSGPPSPESVAAGKAIRAFDSTMADAMSADLLHGDPAAVEAWRTAIGRRREVGELFEQGDLVDRLTERTGTGGQRRLKVEPGDASNLIFGRSSMGSVGRTNLYPDLVKMRDMLGANSDAWNGLRGEMFSRMARSGEGGVEGGVQQFSGVKFLKSWNDFKAKDMRLAETMFTPEEISTINQFAATSARVTGPVKGGDNSSNSAVTMKALKLMGGLVGRLGKAVPIVGDTVFKQLDDFIGEHLTRRAIQGRPRLAVPNPTTGLPGYLAAASGGFLATPDPSSGQGRK